MPKYMPTPDDLYETTKCLVCGEDTGDKNKDTCSWQCEAEKSYYEDFAKEVFYESLMEDEGEI